MRTIIFFLLIILTNGAMAQDSTKRYTFKEIGWTFTLPVGFKELDSMANNKNIERGKKAFEESNDVVADVSELKTLFSAIKGTFQYISATLTPFDPKKDGDYLIANKEVKGITYNTLADQIPGAKLDSSSTKITIDGLGFDKFIIVVKINELTMTMGIVSKLYKGYDFGISYMYMDEKTREQIEASISSSKFRK
jgi:hypothetical protein